MVSVKLQRHFETNDSEFKEKGTEDFKRRCDQLFESQNLFLQLFKLEMTKATEAYNRVSYLIALAGEAHTIAERLINPCTDDVTECMLDEKSVKEITAVPLSNNTVTHRIKELAANMKNEVISRLQNCIFALQMDESTDVTGIAILFVLVRYQHQLTIEEGFFYVNSCQQTQLVLKHSVC
ncbi:zinc finger BED domain-containing protein 5-like [Tachypleus tridentatus]|uniref:zinc finger BED domain-containing protein 5-like n=1 Tax=Tachypleus tridentatus TaxID=6853 RepID=UPI003FD3D796